MRWERSAAYSRLQLWDIRNVSRHGRSSDEASVAVILHLLTHHIHASAFVLLAEDLARGLRTVEDRVKIRSYDLVIVGELAIDHPALSPGNTGIGDEDVETTVEVASDLIDDFLGIFK